MARTIGFDRNDVLDKVINTFWEQRYTQTSIPDLVKATGLQPGSLYSAFKSKEGLLLASLERFQETGLKRIRAYMGQSSSSLEGVKLFLQGIVDETLDDKRRRGCFVVNTLLELSPGSEKVELLIQQCLAAVEKELCSALQRAVKEGELPLDSQPEHLAKFLMVNIWGLRVLAKTHPNEEQARFIYKQLISCLTK